MSNKMDLKIEGVDFPMYGEFDCPGCHRHWNSCRAWRDFGQKCDSCNDEIKAYHLEELFYYHCKNCKITWKNKKLSEGMLCERCSTRTMPKSYRVYKEFVSMMDAAERFREIDYNVSHKRDLCEKCLAYGVDCSSSTVLKKRNERVMKIRENPSGLQQQDNSLSRKGETSGLEKLKTKNEEVLEKENPIQSESVKSKMRIAARLKEIAIEREESRKEVVKRQIRRIEVARAKEEDLRLQTETSTLQRGVPRALVPSSLVRGLGNLAIIAESDETHYDYL